MKLRSWLQRSVSLPTIPIRSALTMIVLYMIASVATAIFISNDPNWSRWHISYLGEHPGFTADFFNYSMMIGGTLMVWFSFQLQRYLRMENDRRKNSPPIRATGIGVATLLIGVSVYAVGLFPLSYGNLPHDIFGYSIYLTCVFLCVTSPWLLPGMKRQFYVIHYLFHILTLTIFILFWVGWSENMYLAEVVTFVSFAWWLDMIVSRRAYVD